MKSKRSNIWSSLSSSQKLNLIGSGLMMISLFLNWFSDTDIFRSGDTYTGLSGPLYLVGFSLLMISLLNVITTLAKALDWSIVKGLDESKIGKLQMMAGFSSMYLLLLVNSVYFSPLFGLNILSKRSEIGVMLALISTVMICIGGYLAYRKKFEIMEKVELRPTPKTVASPTVQVNSERTHMPVLNQPERLVNSPETQPEMANITPVSKGGSGGYYSERDPRGKTDYEKNKLYENLRKTMLRDTMSPQQRKKERTKETHRNAFSANFGETKKLVVAQKTNSVSGEPTRKNAGEDSQSSDKKPQMYRMDL